MGNNRKGKHMNKLILANFKKDTNIEVTKDQLVNLRDIFIKLENIKKDNLKTKVISNKNFQQFANINLVNIKFDNENEFYFKENEDYIIKVEGGKTKPFKNYYVTQRTAEIILGRSKTLLGKQIMNKLFDLFHNIEKYNYSRIDTKTGFRPLTDAIKEAHTPNDKFYHYSNEIDMINKIATGYSAKQYKETFNVENIRDNLTPEQIKLMNKLQIINTGMIEEDIDFEARK